MGPHAVFETKGTEIHLAFCTVKLVYSVQYSTISDSKANNIHTNLQYLQPSIAFARRPLTVGQFQSRSGGAGGNNERVESVDTERSRISMELSGHPPMRLGGMSQDIHMELSIIAHAARDGRTEVERSPSKMHMLLICTEHGPQSHYSYVGV